MKETGPVYGVELIATLPLGVGQMKQALPSADDLKRVYDAGFERVAAGYEVLLAHYVQACRDRDEAMGAARYLFGRTTIRSKTKSEMLGWHPWLGQEIDM